MTYSFYGYDVSENPHGILVICDEEVKAKNLRGAILKEVSTCIRYLNSYILKDVPEDESIYRDYIHKLNIGDYEQYYSDGEMEIVVILG